MPYRDVYVGNLDYNDFTWTPTEEKFSIGNSPKRISPFFPPTHLGLDPFGTIKARVEAGVYFGRKVDWGCWVAIVTKQELIDFINEVYTIEWHNYYSGSMPYIVDQLNEVLEYVNKLSNKKKYGLVASEL